MLLTLEIRHKAILDTGSLAMSNFFVVIGWLFGSLGLSTAKKSLNFIQMLKLILKPYALSQCIYGSRSVMVRNEKATGTQQV